MELGGNAEEEKWGRKKTKIGLERPNMHFHKRKHTNHDRLTCTSHIEKQFFYDYCSCLFNHPSVYLLTRFVQKYTLMYFCSIPKKLEFSEFFKNCLENHSEIAKLQYTLLYSCQFIKKYDFFKNLVWHRKLARKSLCDSKIPLHTTLLLPIYQKIRFFQKFGLAPKIS